MTPLEKIDVISSKINRENSEVVFKISQYKKVLNRIHIGESIISNEFYLNYPSFRASKWILIFYPKGQYDFGKASEDSRVYIKLLSNESRDALTLRMNVWMTTSLIPQSHSKEITSVFIDNNNYNHWAGPIHLKLIQDNQLTDYLTITCTFKLVSNVSKDQRSAGQINYSNVQTGAKTSRITDKKAGLSIPNMYSSRLTASLTNRNGKDGKPSKENPPKKKMKSRVSDIQIESTSKNETRKSQVYPEKLNEERTVNKTLGFYENIFKL